MKKTASVLAFILGFALMYNCGIMLRYDMAHKAELMAGLAEDDTHGNISAFNTRIGNFEARRAFEYKNGIAGIVALIGGFALWPIAKRERVVPALAQPQ